jgi:hypothetical protein
MASLRVPLGILAAGALALPLAACASPTSGSATSETVVSVVVRAESDAGGRALELDREDDGAWEVHVLTSGSVHEVRVSPDGARVLSREDGDAADADDRAALDTAATTMADAVRIAVAARGGASVDEVDLDRAGGAEVWRVAFADGSETAVSLADGSVESPSR